MIKTYYGCKGSAFISYTDMNVVINTLLITVYKHLKG